jgi:NAD(P)-dependent dehydrogenase (short-subunit alcohol dehydrogenase family)
MNRRQIRLDGRVVAVTGGARGIGEATARRLAVAGARVVVGDLDLDVAEASVAAYGAMALPLDVTSRSSVAEFLDKTLAEHGRLDAMVNNAGYMVLGRVTETPLERQLGQIDVNLNGVVLGCHEAATRLGDGGVIVNIASLAGRVPMPGAAVYSATKAAVLSFTEALDAELAPQGIRVGAVLPSFTNTGLIAGTDAHGMTKPVEPSDVAEAVAAMIARPKATSVVPKWMASSAATWPMTSSRVKPWLRRKFGIETIFTDFDAEQREAYDKRTSR